MKTEIMIFESPEFGRIRTVNDEKGEPWFIGKDVAIILGYSNVRDAIYKHVDREDKGVANCDSLGGRQKTTIINESGLYSLILQSKLPRIAATYWFSYLPPISCNMMLHFMVCPFSAFWLCTAKASLCCTTLIIFVSIDT